MSSGDAGKQTQWTVKSILEWTARFFSERGITTARLDAEILLAHALGSNRLQLYLNLDRPLSAAERAGYRELVKRRAAREPTALIVGRREFWSISFKVASGVLIPRPETETLVEAVVEEIQHVDNPWILEIGTGCGAVSVAVLRERPSARVLATDISLGALACARSNARSAGVADSLDLLASDVFSAIRAKKQFDVICSNPPYIPTTEIAGLEPEIRLFEPLAALDGGSDGLDVIRLLAGKARDYLKVGGAVLLEVGDGQHNQCAEILGSVGGLSRIATYRDLAGKTRVVKGR